VSEQNNSTDNVKVNRFWSLPLKKKDAWVEETVPLCRDHCLFEGISERSVYHIVTRMHSRQYQKGEMVFDMGQSGAGAMFILSGEVAILADAVELAHLHRGDLFGEVALATSLPRTAQAMALTNCSLVFFMRSDLDEWIDRAPKEAARFLVNLSTMLAERLLGRNLELMEAAE